METELLGGVALPVDLPAALLEHAADVRALDIVQALGGRLAGRAAAEAPNVSSRRSVEPGERMRARSITFSSSRTLPGHA